MLLIMPLDERAIQRASHPTNAPGAS